MTRRVLKMPFGKFAGQRLADIPESYLKWAFENCQSLPPRLRKGIARQLGIGRRPERSAGGVEAGQLEDLVNGWYRQLCLDLHPDRAGSNDKMIGAMYAVDELRRLLGMK